MFCPQCGQQQATDDVRFCSRCGFQLQAVSTLMQSNGISPEMVAANSGAESPRRRGVRHGVALMLIGIFLIPLFFMMHEISGTPDVLAMIGLLGAMGGLLRIIYALFESKVAPPPKHFTDAAYTPPPFASVGARAQLPPTQFASARDFAARPTRGTAEIAAQPPSVTEGTTRLLEDERDAPPGS